MLLRAVWVSQEVRPDPTDLNTPRHSKGFSSFKASHDVVRRRAHAWPSRRRASHHRARAMTLPWSLRMCKARSRRLGASRGLPQEPIGARSGHLLVARSHGVRLHLVVGSEPACDGDGAETARRHDSAGLGQAQRVRGAVAMFMVDVYLYIIYSNTGSKYTACRSYNGTYTCTSPVQSVGAAQWVMGTTYHEVHTTHKFVDDDVDVGDDDVENDVDVDGGGTVGGYFRTVKTWNWSIYRLITYYLHILVCPI